MAEAVTAVNLVASIVSLVEFGGKVILRLHEFCSDTDTVPKNVRDVNIQLPLLLNTLKATKEQALSGEVSCQT